MIYMKSRGLYQSPDAVRVPHNYLVAGGFDSCPRPSAGDKRRAGIGIPGSPESSRRFTGSFSSDSPGATAPELVRLMPIQGLSSDKYLVNQRLHYPRDLFQWDQATPPK